ncbi:hypothetical protein [Streptomyces aureus]|uniref:hypothetical protein n=1 Tax=Streptomyces aureus TaxID=193461 RepID=UPI00367B26E6
MQLFTDPGLNFNALLALGSAGFGASEVGEVLTAVNAINAAGANEQTYDAETFYPGQPRAFLDLLRTRKEFRLMRAANGAQLHCSPMAPQQHCEVVFDWLEDTLGRGARG